MTTMHTFKWGKWFSKRRQWETCRTLQLFI